MKSIASPLAHDQVFSPQSLQPFFASGSKAGIQAKHVDKLRLMLARLDSASCAEDMAAPGWRLHRLAHDLSQHWAIKVDGNRRLIFAFENGDAASVDYLDYH